jgi:hypothetical protein
MTDDAGPDNCPDCLEVSLDRDDTGYALCERHALAEAVSGWNCDLCGDCVCHGERDAEVRALVEAARAVSLWLRGEGPGSAMISERLHSALKPFEEAQP